MLKYLFILAIAVLSGCATTPSTSEKKGSYYQLNKANLALNSNVPTKARLETKRRYKEIAEEKKIAEERQKKWEKMNLSKSKLTTN